MNRRKLTRRRWQSGTQVPSREEQTLSERGRYWQGGREGRAMQAGRQARRRRTRVKGAETEGRMEERDGRQRRFGRLGQRCSGWKGRKGGKGGSTVTMRPSWPAWARLASRRRRWLGGWLAWLGWLSGERAVPREGVAVLDLDCGATVVVVLPAETATPLAASVALRPPR